MNEELNDAAVTAAVAGYPRTGRDLADGYMLAALVIRATYEPADPEIDRALRLYTGGVDRMEDLSRALMAVASAVVEAARMHGVRELAAWASEAPVTVNANTRYEMKGELRYDGDASADLADAAFRQMETQVMPSVGEVSERVAQNAVDTLITGRGEAPGGPRGYVPPRDARDADTQVMPRVPGEVTQEIRRPCRHPGIILGVEMCPRCGLV